MSLLNIEKNAKDKEPQARFADAPWVSSLAGCSLLQACCGSHYTVPEQTGSRTRPIYLTMHTADEYECV